MQISIRAPAGLVSHQMRAYAEYRVFEALARFGRAVRGATVNLDRTDSHDDLITCVIDVDLAEDAAVRCRSRRKQAAEAVDRAAVRARRAIERRVMQPRGAGTGA